MNITAEPRSDQWNADDLVGSPRTFTVAGVKAGTAEQKYDIELVEGEGRVWRPPLTVLRILIKAWGSESSAWIGQRATLYRDETVKFGNESAPGIRVSHVSGIDKPLTIALTATRGKRRPVTVHPLPDTPTPTDPTPAQIAAVTDVAELRDLYRAAKSDEIRALITARKDEIEAAS